MLSCVSRASFIVMFPSIFSNLSDFCGLVGHLGTIDRLPMGLLSLRVPSNSPPTLDSHRPVAYLIVVDYTPYELKWKRMELSTRRSTSRIVALRLSFPGSQQIGLYDSIARRSGDWLSLRTKLASLQKKSRWIRVRNSFLRNWVSKWLNSLKWFLNFKIIIPSLLILFNIFW